MLTARTVAELRAALGPARRAGRRIGLVPTMGALHDGHISLLDRARRECDVVVMSLFVNPRQFDEAADLRAYPRNEARDAELAAGAGVDVLFAPAPESVYPAGFATTISVGGPAEGLESAHRGRGHFDGVATVVAKLLGMVGPEIAYFGQKDAQQLAVVRRLVADLDIPCTIVACPTIREPDGLAMSSRNALLGPRDRARAGALYAALQSVRAAVAGGERDPAAATAPGRALVAAAGAELEYLALVDPRTMEPLAELDGDALAVLAARLGGVRLIDNLQLGGTPPQQPPNTTPVGGHDAHATTRPRPRGRDRRSRADRVEERPAMSATPRAPVPEALDRPLPMTLPRLAEKKRLGEPIVMMTAYDYPSAQVAEQAGIDIVLVGDSGAMTVLGYPSTVPVTLEEMLMLAAAARRGLTTPLLVADLPFGSYERSDAQAIASAQRFVKEAGVDAVKLERAGTSAERARAIVQAGIPVMGHLGLTPQSATSLGGYRAQGRTARAALALVRDARALQESGCFALVLEAIPAAVAEALMEVLEIPVIGTGAGDATDGQVLVFHDLLGIHDGHVARFAKRYADIRAQMVAAVARYAEEVRGRTFPAPEHFYSIDDSELRSFREGLAAASSGLVRSRTAADIHAPVFGA